MRPSIRRRRSKISCGRESYQTGSEAAAAAEQRGRVRVVVDSVCGGGEVKSSVNVDVNDDKQCGHRYRDEDLEMYCGGKNYRTGSEAEAAAEQRGASELSSIASAAAEKSDRARMLTSTTMDDAAVNTETKV